MLKIIRLISCLFILLTVPFAYAAEIKPSEPQPATPQNISLYQQPDVKSSIVSTLKSNQPIVFIFSQNEWSKVADPSNGNVGWVKNETLKQAGVPYINTMVQSINNPNSSGYKVFQYMGAEPVDAKQAQEMTKQWETQRIELQKIYNEAFQQNLKALNQITKELQNVQLQVPMMMPVLQPVVMTPQQTTGKTAPVKNESGTDLGSE